MKLLLSIFTILNFLSLNLLASEEDHFRAKPLGDTENKKVKLVKALLSGQFKENGNGVTETHEKPKEVKKQKNPKPIDGSK